MRAPAACLVPTYRAHEEGEPRHTSASGRQRSRASPVMESLVLRLAAAGLILVTFFSPAAVVLDPAGLDEGTVSLCGQ